MSNITNTYTNENMNTTLPVLLQPDAFSGDVGTISLLSETTSNVKDDCKKCDNEKYTSSSHSNENSDACFTDFTFTENSELYVVSVDNVPFCYVNDKKNASVIMWKLAQRYASQCTFRGLRTNYLQISDTELHLLGSYKFYLVSYDRVLKRVSFTQVRECV